MSGECDLCGGDHTESAHEIVQRTPATPDVYRLGWLPWERWSMWRTTRALGQDAVLRGSFRPSSDRWRRPYQAEWEGCPRAVRGFTRQGTIRKAARRIAASLPDHTKEA